MTGNRVRSVRAAKRQITKNPEIAEKQATALRMRTEGYTYEQIADALGYANRASAWKLVQEGIALVVMEPAEDLRKLELRRLDMALKEMVVQVLQGTPSAKREAVDRMIKIMDRRARYLGLDVPTRMNVGLERQTDEVDDLLSLPGGAELMAQIEAFVAGAAEARKVDTELVE